MIFAWCRDARGADASPELKITIEFHMEGSKNPPPPWQLEDNHDGNAYFLVILENISAKPLLVDQNVMGVIDSIYFEVTDEDGQKIKVYQEVPIPTAYVPAPPLRLAPRDTHAVKIHYVYLNIGGANNWYKYRFSFPPAGEKRQVTIRAVIESMADKNAEMLKSMEQSPAYTAEMLKDQRAQAAARLQEAEKKGFWVGGAQSEPYQVTLIGSKP